MTTTFAVTAVSAAANGKILSSSGVPIGSGFQFVAVSGHYAVDATSSPVTALLPTSAAAGTVVSVEKIDSTTNYVNVSGSIRDVGGGSLNLQLQHETVEFIADASGSWWPVAGQKTLSSLDARYPQAGAYVPPPVASAVLGQMLAVSQVSPLKMGWQSPGMRSATLTVAAYNATASEIAQADYQCDGVGDEVQINAAISALSTVNGGIVHLSSGTFNIANPVLMNSNSLKIQGSGVLATEIYLSNGANCNMFQWPGTLNIQWFSMESLKIYGNNANNSSGYGIYIAPPSTTVAAGSNGGEISQIATWGGTYGGNGVLAVASTAGFSTSGGQITVAASGSTTAIVNYTGISGNTFTGCTYVSGSSTGTVATGGAVAANYTFWDSVYRDVFVEYAAQDGFYSYDGHGFVLDHFLAEYNGGYAVNFPTTGGAEPEVRNGTFKDNTSGGIYMGIAGGMVAENEVSNNFGPGITLAGQGAYAIGNELSSNSGVGIILNATGAIAIANYVTQNTSHGIEAENIGCIIANNTVSKNSGYGVYLLSDADMVCMGNLIIENAEYGIYCNAPNATITGNALYENSHGNTGTYDEINIASSGVSVTSNQINGVSTSRYGVNYSNGSGTGGLCALNTITGELTGAVNVASGNGVTLLKNPGYNPVGTIAISVPSSGSATTAQPVDTTFYITTSTGTTTVAISGGPTVTLTASALNTIRVPATKTLTPTYTNAPTWLVEGE